jgi:hypothetical protein
MSYKFRRTPFGVDTSTNLSPPVVQYAEQLFVFDMEFTQRDFSCHGPNAEDECCFHYICLINGLTGGPSKHEAMAADAWQRWRPRVLDIWIKKAPGTRPLCWWRYDSPLKQVPQIFEGAMHLPDGLTQPQYLDRNDVLTPYERKKLPRAALIETTAVKLIAGEEA